MKPLDRKTLTQFSPPAPLDGLFLPDLCSIRILLIVIVIAELLAFVLTLAGGGSGNGWEELGLISLFVQWVALCSVLLLCVSRPWLAKFENNHAGLISFLMITVITVLMSELTFNYIFLPNVDRSAAAHIDFLLRNLGISVIVSYLTLRYFYLQYQSSKSMLAENISRIEALQARIRPHFLFNSMNVIASLTRSDPKLAEQAVENLAQVFRASLSDMKKQITVFEEISICKSYLQIEALRLGDRLKVNWQINAQVENDMIPPLLLQPLIENAVIHGIEPRKDGGLISISAEHNNDKQQIEIVVSNPCDEVSDECNNPSKGNQLALKNITDRLEALYEGESHLLIEHQENKYIATITIPMNMLRGDVL